MVGDGKELYFECSLHFFNTFSFDNQFIRFALFCSRFYPHRIYEYNALSLVHRAELYQ